MKRVLALLLVFVLVMGTLTGCAKEEEAAGTETTTGTDNAAAGDSKEFLIGGIGPVTGSAASYGLSVQYGAEVAIEEINAAGGVNVNGETYTLKLQFEDDEATEDKAIAAYGTLMDDGMNALMGTVTSGACLAVIDSSYEDGILQVTPSGSALGITEHPNCFRICFTDPLQGVTLADYAKNDLGYTKAAVIYNNADEYSTGVMEAFVEQYEANGGEVVACEAFVTDDVDFSSQLTTIKGTDAEVIIVPAYYQDATYITKQAAELGMELPFLGSDGWDGVLGTVTDTATVEGAIFLSPFFAADEDELIQKFVAAYKEKTGETPDQFAADAYDAVYVIKAAMEAAGSIESEDLIAAMTEITVDGTTGKGITFDADGEPSKGASFIEIKNGVYTKR